MTAGAPPEENRPDLVNHWIRRFNLESVQKLTGIETTTQIAELLWLATQLDLPDRSSGASDSDSDSESESDAPKDALTAGSDRSSPSSKSTDSKPPRQAPSPKVDLVTQPPQKALPESVLQVQVVDPAMLADPLGIIKALKPLFQKVDAGTGRRLNEPETVDFIARTDLVVPKLQPDREAWFDIILVVDRSSASMIIWQRLVADIVRTLRQYGAFRDVRVYDLVIYADAQPAHGETPVMLRSRPHRPDHHPKELIDQQGRRLAIILSDMTAAHWWRGTVTPVLEDWGRHMPVVVWQLLPPWLWQRTALGRGTPVSMRNALPGAANQRWQLRPAHQGARAMPQHPVALPVVTSAAYDLSRWSQLVVGKPVVAPGYMLPPVGGSVPRTTSGTQSLDDLGAASQRVQRFLRLASPEAQWLLMLLAAAPVITLPIARLIRKAKLPDVTSPLPIVEVFTSGLLQRQPEQPQSRSQAVVQYDFVGAVRTALLTGKWLPPVEAIEVINSVSRAIEKNFNRLYPHTFQAYLKDPTIDLPDGLEGLKAFATITADILDQLGTPYTNLVQQLRFGANKRPIPITELDPYGNRLQIFDYEVAEYLNFPEIQDMGYTEAFLYDDTWPPPLQTETVKVVTVEVPGDDPPLEPFDFTIATLIYNDATVAWDINRQPGQAEHFIEPLPDDISLDMVAIPGGTFQMGSPEDEPERLDREGPQQEVTISPFCMGRYPVTQAQWRVVASLPQVKQNLGAEPSRFEGDDRPVERVSWNDAVEFCARLSVYTGREYRLPSEAEWEYACRAGTTTPFHVGETITTDLANYDGNETYGGGSTGEYRQETTPVGYFEHANAFGLCDMHGNVWEWCADHWHGNYEGAPTDGSAWIEGGDEARRVVRGGSWDDYPWNCRSAYRNSDFRDSRYTHFGFRVSCAAPRALR